MEKVITKLYNINERSELKPKYIMKKSQKSHYVYEKLP